MDLNRKVNGNGSFTVWVGRLVISARFLLPHLVLGTSVIRISIEPGRLTDHKTSKKGIDPTHNQGLWYHHRHISLHHTHHSLHGRWVRHRIRRRFAPALRILEECSILECRHQVGLAGIKRCGRDDVGIRS